MEPNDKDEDYNWDNFARDLAWAEGRVIEEEVVDAEVIDAPPALPEGEEK